MNLTVSEVRRATRDGLLDAVDVVLAAIGEQVGSEGDDEARADAAEIEKVRKLIREKRVPWRKPRRDA